MQVVMEKGDRKLATVYVARFRDGRYILEFVDSLSGSPGVEEKWVVVVSSQFGCPVGCLMCDAGGYYLGEPDVEELFQQVDYVVRKRFPDGRIPSRKFKVQFARMGEPSLNDSIGEAINLIRERYHAPGFMPCISTVAPRGRDNFFEEMLELNHKVFRGHFQMQFSVHSTDEKQRDRIIPVKKWALDEIAEYGKQFYTGGRKVTLNFALAPENAIEPDVISSLFPPDVFAVKITPVNPTGNAEMHGLVSEPDLVRARPEISELRRRNYEVIVSIGDLRENAIGSNCGQLVALWKKGEASSQGV